MGFAGAFNACKMMRSAILFLLIISPSVFTKELRQGVTDSIKDLTALYVKECQGTCNVNEEIVSEWLNTGKTPDDHDFKGFLKCLYEKWGMIDQNGTVNNKAMEDVALRLPGGNVEMVTNCLKEITGVKDPVEVPYKLVVCFIDAFSV